MNIKIESLAKATTTLTRAGSKQTVLAPQLYARVKAGDIDGAGALLSANHLQLALTGDLTNLGTIAGRELVTLSAGNLRNLGGRIRGMDTWLSARQDLENLGGSLEGEERLTARAGRDLKVQSTTHSTTSAQAPGNTRTHLDRLAGLYVTNPGGTLVAAAGRDLDLIAAALVNAAPTAASPSPLAGEGRGEGATTLLAGRNLALGTVTTAYAEKVGDGKHARQESGSSEVGSLIQSAGDLTLIAGRDLTARAAEVTSDQGRLLASAGNDIRIEAGESTLNVAEQHKTKSKGFLSTKKTTTRDTLNDTSALASTFSADSTTLIAERDIAIKGSNVVATNDTTLIATRNLSIEAASETHTETHFTKTKQSGVYSSGGVGFTLGSKQQSTDQQTDATLAAGSTLGSTDGNVLLLAGENYRQVGSDVIAVQGDIDIAAKTVDIVEARQTSRTVTETKSKQSGLTIAMTSPVISAIQTVQQMSEAANNTKDPRMQLLAAANVGLSASNAADAIKAGQGTTIDGKANQIPVLDESGKTVGIGINISIGSSKSSSKTTQTSNTAAASNLTAGRDITVIATPSPPAGEGGGEGAGDITVQGSALSAGRHLTLTADDEIRLLAARNTTEQHSAHKNSSASVGIGFALGGTQNGFTLNASVSQGQGRANGKSLDHLNSKVSAGDTARLASGGDTRLSGAVVEGRRIAANIGGDLEIESLQDTATYRSTQQSAGGSISLCIPPLCAGAAPVSGSVNAGNGKIKSDYRSVTEQSDDAGACKNQGVTGHSLGMLDSGLCLPRSCAAKPDARIVVSEVSDQTAALKKTPSADSPDEPFCPQPGLQCRPLLQSECHHSIPSTLEGV